MKRARINGITLECEASGSGEPVVLIHGALVADAFGPLQEELSLANQYRLISYHRRGYVGSTHLTDEISIAQHAVDCQSLLRHLSVELTHVVGHSYGGSIALQLALDFPDTVHSLALLEPALFGDSTGQIYRDGLARATQRYREAGAEIVVDEFLQARSPQYRNRLDTAVPGAFAQAVSDAGTFFELEIPALQKWQFGEAELRRVQQPVLTVLGGASDSLSPRFGETHRMLLGRLPRAEGFVLPGKTHLMMIEDPRTLAEALAAFHARHPLPA
jgi:pimeloyl-ACP methyl ester carboxylesterase